MCYVVNVINFGTGSLAVLFYTLKSDSVIVENFGIGVPAVPSNPLSSLRLLEVYPGVVCDICEFLEISA